MSRPQTRGGESDAGEEGLVRGTHDLGLFRGNTSSPRLVAWISLLIATLGAKSAIGEHAFLEERFGRGSVKFLKLFDCL